MVDSAAVVQCCRWEGYPGCRGGLRVFRAKFIIRSLWGLVGARGFISVSDKGQHLQRRFHQQLQTVLCVLKQYLTL
ncbi:hypothetical protein I79_008178 [Cricetulus griseus]|uniref:Uncharacterized protein n=1 Tax=Cricetulus griseus TaxID=10029 RepID=G3HCG8_CRIGR|nr:hypothetical protein I79_008178 [Cricetulus griseus]